MWFWTWRLQACFSYLPDSKAMLGKSSHIIASNTGTSQSSADVFFKILKKMLDEDRRLFMMIFWRLWKCRNSKLCGNKTTCVPSLLTTVRDSLHQWWIMRQRHHQCETQTSRDRWIKPPPGFLKCSVKSTLFSANRVMKIGLCFRDSEGKFVWGRTVWSCGSLQLAHSQGLQQVIFVTDSKTVVNAINSPSCFTTELGDIVNQCKSILSLHTD